MTDGSITTSGEKSISLYSTNALKTIIEKGSITAEKGALGLFADNAEIVLGGTGVNNDVKLKRRRWKWNTIIL